MNKTVYKYPIFHAETAIEMPEGAKVIHYGIQNHTQYIWAEVDPDEIPVTFYFFVVGTGHPVPADSFHVGTLFQDPFVWHLYERRNR